MDIYIYIYIYYIYIYIYININSRPSIDCYPMGIVPKIDWERP